MKKRVCEHAKGRNNDSETLPKERRLPSPAEQRTLLLQRLIGPLWVVGALVTPARVQPPTMDGHLLLENCKKKVGFGFGFGCQPQESKKSANSRNFA